MPEKNINFQSVINPTGVSIFERLNEGAVKIDGRTYPPGGWTVDALKAIKRIGINNIDWNEVLRAKDTDYCSEDDYNRIVKARKESGNSRVNFSMRKEYVDYLDEVVIPTLTEYYPQLKTYIRTNVAIVLIMIWFVDNDPDIGMKYFVRPEAAKPQESTGNE